MIYAKNKDTLYLYYSDNYITQSEYEKSKTLKVGYSVIPDEAIIISKEEYEKILFEQEIKFSISTK